MCIQRHNDLIAQRALIFEIEPRQGQAKSLCLLRACGNQFQGELAGKRPQVCQDLNRLLAVGGQPVLKQHRLQHGLQLIVRARGYDQVMCRLGAGSRHIVNQIVRSVLPAAMVEKLNPHISVDGEHPIADLVNLVDQFSLGHIETKGHDGYGLETGTRSSNR